MHNTGIRYSSKERMPTVLSEMAELLPPLSGEQLAVLEADLLANGCYAPVIVNEDMVIVDGHNRQMLDDLTTRDQRMLFAVVTLVHLADSKEELDSDTETLRSTARKHLCQLSTLNWQQADGLVTALPLGLRRIDALRTLTTEALAVLMPFKAQEIRHQGGVYYGQNTISKNLILANRKELLNGNGFVLGVSGSGKSFTAKREMVGLALSTEDDIIVIDPESEYRPLMEGLGGEVINISATSSNHINAMDMEQGYGDGDDPVVLKSEFILSLCEQLMGAGKLSAKEKSIIDRCTALCYHTYIQNGCEGTVPTLRDFHAELLRQPETEAKDPAGGFSYQHIGRKYGESHLPTGTPGKDRTWNRQHRGRYGSYRQRKMLTLR